MEKCFQNNFVISELVQQLTHDLKFKGCNPALLSNGSSRVIEHLSPHPKFEGSSTVAAASTGVEGGRRLRVVGTPRRAPFKGEEGGIPVLAGLAPSSQTVGSNIGVIHEQAKRSS